MKGEGKRELTVFLGAEIVDVHGQDGLGLAHLLEGFLLGLGRVLIVLVALLLLVLLVGELLVLLLLCGEHDGVADELAGWMILRKKSIFKTD